MNTKLPASVVWSENLGGYDPNPWKWEINEESTPTADRGCVPANREMAIKVAPECVEMHIPQHFDFIPVVAWSVDKLTHRESAPEKGFPYRVDSWSMSGRFPRAPKAHIACKEVDGREYHTIVAVTPPKYKGEKHFVTITLAMYTPA